MSARSSPLRFRRRRCISGSCECVEFVPTFPSGCPYVASVGATQGISPETAADFSSGGF
ncbi:hypothetical protein FOMPIDRAFT_91996 [Fomitopsis schrenkii]|uniref:Uncharacterized protein n=1 Tax=Fomitopsis schrenkii TaxID=2126942 RepID=S8F0B8_FOMSC|nr:hypothetical protein FOMPIDRAFT_91996 [Fomitopsis schrenkii]